MLPYEDLEHVKLPPEGSWAYRFLVFFAWLQVAILVGACVLRLLGFIG